MIRGKSEGHLTVEQTGSVVADVELSRGPVGQELRVDLEVRGLGLQTLGVARHSESVLFAFEVEVPILFVIFCELLGGVLIWAVLEVLLSIDQCETSIKSRLPVSGVAVIHGHAPVHVLARVL